MSQPANGASTPTPVVPHPPISPNIDWHDPASIALYLTGVLAVVGYVFHKDLTNLAGPLATLAVAVIAGVKAIEQAIKQKSYQAALQEYNALRIDHYVSVANPPISNHAIQNAFDAVASHIADVESKVDALAPRKAPQRPAGGRMAARKPGRPRKTATTR